MKNDCAKKYSVFSNYCNNNLKEVKKENNLFIILFIRIKKSYYFWF